MPMLSALRGVRPWSNSWAMTAVMKIAAEIAPAIAWLCSWREPARKDGTREEKRPLSV